MGDKRSDILFQGRSYFLSDRFFDAQNSFVRINFAVVRS